MELTVDKRALKDVLDWSKRVAPEQVALALKADGDTLTAQIPNDVGEHHESAVVSEVKQAGSGLVSRSVLLNTVDSMSGSTLSLTREGDTLVVVGEDGSSSLGVEDTRIVEAPEVTVLARMKQADFQYAVQGVKESVGKRSFKGTGNILNGFVTVRDGETTLYATNRFLSYRATVKTRTRDVEPQSFGITPLKWGGSVTQMTSRLELVVTERGFYGLRDGQTIDTFVPVDASDVEKIAGVLDDLHAASASDSSLVVPKPKFNQALNTLKKQGTNVKARVHHDGESLYVDAEADRFSSSKAVSASDVEGSGFDRVLFPDNMMKALRTVKSKTVQLRFPEDSRYPVGVYSNDSETLDALSFVMTVREKGVV